MDLTALALSMQFRSLAKRWNELPLPSNYDLLENELAADCWDIIAKAFDHGCLSMVREDLLYMIALKEAEVARERENSTEFSFLPLGFQFFLLAGYASETQDEQCIEVDAEGIEVTRRYRMFKPGLIDSIVSAELGEGVFPTLSEWEIRSGSFERSNPEVRRWIHRQYGVLLDLLCEMLLLPAAVTDEANPKIVTSECEEYIYMAWLESRKNGDRANRQLILISVMERFPDPEKRRITSGSSQGMCIQTVAQVDTVIKRLDQAAKRKKPKS